MSYKTGCSMFFKNRFSHYSMSISVMSIWTVFGSLGARFTILFYLDLFWSLTLSRYKTEWLVRLTNARSARLHDVYSSHSLCRSSIENALSVCRVATAAAAVTVEMSIGVYQTRCCKITRSSAILGNKICVNPEPCDTRTRKSCSVSFNLSVVLFL